MRWPDIFFKTKVPKRNAEPEAAPSSGDSPPAPNDSLASAVTPAPVTRAPALASDTPTLKSSVLESRHLTIPSTGGLASRIPTRTATVKTTPAPAPTESPAPATSLPAEKNVGKDMAEADTLRALTRSGGLLLLKRAAENPPSAIAPSAPKSEAPQISEPLQSSTPVEEKKTDTAPKPSEAGTPLPAGVSIFRRKTRMADVARIVLPPKREDQKEPTSTPPDSPPPAAVVPPAFPVTVATGSIIGNPTPEPSSPSVPTTSQPTPFTEIPTTNQTAPNTDASTTLPIQQKEEAPVTTPVEMPKTDAVPVAPEPEKKADMPAPTPIAEEKPAAPPPKIEPAPEQPPIPPPAIPTPPDSANLPVSSREKQEFLLSNGERILGRILSETADTLFINHDTLGVLTIPREQIAKRLIEIILINGDRIVGDVIAETPECLYVRHASLGMLTVPHKQRSTRVVEAILKDGDRILGEVLAETENFTVIRSATLGTVAVQHAHVAMLNRKIEQIQLKALPPATPSIENKPTA